MKLYILTMVNGYAELLSLTPFKSETGARAEMRRQYDKEVKQIEENEETGQWEFHNKHAEVINIGCEYSYSWDITEVDTEKLQ